MFAVQSIRNQLKKSVKHKTIMICILTIIWITSHAAFLPYDRVGLYGPEPCYLALIQICLGLLNLARTRRRRYHHLLQINPAGLCKKFSEMCRRSHYITHNFFKCIVDNWLFNLSDSFILGVIVNISKFRIQVTDSKVE